jgi:hypothetical protein
MKMNKRLLAQASAVVLISAVLLWAPLASGQEPSPATGNRAGFPDVEAGEKVIARHKTELMQIPGVTGIQLGPPGTIIVLVKHITTEVVRSVPMTLDGWSVRFMTYDPAEGVDHGTADSQ